MPNGYHWSKPAEYDLVKAAAVPAAITILVKIITDGPKIISGIKKLSASLQQEKTFVDALMNGSVVPDQAN